MKDILLIVALNIVAIVCLAAAGVLAYEQLDGWGWFLFVGFLLSVTNYTNRGED